MKFISFIASTMLIALISQQSTMGLPLNTTVEEETCSKGFELIDGHCKPIKSELHENVESASIPVEFTTILDETVFKKVTPPLDGGCADGWEHGEHGICQEIKSKLHETNVESTSMPFEIPTLVTEKVVLKEDKPEISGRCPEGMEHGKYGICQDIKSTSTPVYITIAPQEKLVLKEKPELPIYGGCREGMEHGEHGICQDIKSHDMIEATTELTDDAAKLSDHTVRQKDDIVRPKGKIVKPKKDIVEPKEDIVEPKDDVVKPKPDIVKPKEDTVKPKKDNVKVTDDSLEKKDDVKSKEDIVKPKEDIVEPKDDIVEPKEDIVKPKEDVDESKEDIVKPKHDSIKSTDDTLKKKDDVVTKPTKYEIPRGCPKGTQPDERGYCLDIKPFKLTKIIFNPKILLAKDGSCPRNYVMIKELCYYVNPRKNLRLRPSFSTADDFFSNAFQTKKYTDDSIKYEYVLVLVDNSCPEGTEHSDYGLCRRRVYPTMSNKFIKVDGRCDVDNELLDGKCVLKKKVEMPDLLNMTKTSEPISVTLEPESYHKEEPKKFTKVY
ncbi:unnamed protein product [Adineta steineri]|uniref:Uncharacterized protein n=1 Tax=Adineta steineri TaxID=433720 RepID=A0A813PWN6_9BILA|nr:unnamed protein product [Adineta steineri]